MKRVSISPARQFLFISGVALAFCLAARARQQSAVGDTPAHSPASVTLRMGWERGDVHYGPNFIRLRQPCQNSDDVTCSCRVRFATRTPKFADYIASFGSGKVPVVYQVIYGSDGQASAVRFLSVGTWTRDKLSSPNDGLIEVEFGHESPQQGQRTRHRVKSPADCFPTLPGGTLSPNSNN
jgi:hypothetical protein